MKKWIAVTVIGVVCSLLFALFAPAYQRDKVIGLFTFMRNDRQCFNFHKKDFKDPDSAYMESSYIWTRADEKEYNKSNRNPIFKKYEAVVRVKVHAKNSMGGYVSDSIECPLVDGKFNDHAAEMVRLDDLIKRIK
jgi:hypothetical protein